MIKLLLPLVILATLKPLPANSGVILPSIFATEFCSLRDRGLDFKNSLDMAAKGSHVEGEPKRVKFHGVDVDQDVIQSWEAIYAQCPHHIDFSP